VTNLVILAAGIGTRFGGNKQLAEFGILKLTLMEYNLINAAITGFKRVVFVIRHELEPTIMQQIVTRLPDIIDYAFVYQTFDDLPRGCVVPEQRRKPLGTAHALWCCRNIVKDSFAVINADDFYGKHAFSLLLQKNNSTDYLMVAYQLKNTLSDFGGVNRGLCKVDEQNYLTAIEECEQIKRDEKNISGILSASQQKTSLLAESLISMNCWFFTPDIFLALEQALTCMFSTEKEESNLNNECYLPTVVMHQIQQKNKKVKVLSTADSWFGLTYPQDSELVEENITALFAIKQ
jgi:NDP-sugar pyrophosphorylase family protein